MNVKSVEKEGGKATLTVVLEKDQFEAALDKAYRQARGKIQVPGFRKGKAPRKIIESMYGANVFYEDAIDELFPTMYEQALKDAGLKVVGRPSLTAMERQEDGGMELVLETELYPEVKLGQYLGLEVPKASTDIRDEEVEAELSRLADRNARITTVDRAAAEGDTLIFDFDGFLNGKPFEGGKAENYTLKLGSHQMIPGFEDALIGVVAGEEREIEVTFPEDYDPKLAGKPARFRCKIHEVKETMLPEMDDEFAKDVSECDTLDELRADIRARFQKQREEEVQNAFENAAVAMAAQNMTCEVPEVLIEEQLDRSLQEMAFQLKGNGMSLEDYAKIMGGDLSDLRRNMRPAAVATVRSDLLLSQVIEEEKIEASAEEIEAEYQRLADLYKMKVEQVKNITTDDNIRNDLQFRQAIRKIADSAKPVAVVPKSGEEASEEAGGKTEE